MLSANWCSYTALSATNTLLTPAIFAAASAAAPQLLPATRTSISPPILVAAVTTLRVTGFRLALSCSAITKIDITRSPYSTLASFRSEEHTSELQSRPHLVCRLLLEKKNKE